MKKTLLKSMLVAGMMAVSAGAWAQKVGDIVSVNGAEYQVTGTNIIVNGSFDDGVSGWYAGNWAAANAEKYTLATEGGFDGGAYIQYSAGGVGSDTNIRGKWNVENGKMYLFRCYTSGKTPDSNNLQYSALKIYDESKNNDEGDKLYQLKWGADPGQVSDTWTQNDFVFTASYDAVTFRSSWTTDTKLDGFFLGEVERYYSPEGYNNAMSAANAALEDEAYSAITGSERTELSNIINKYKNASSSQYEEAINALDAAVKAFTAAKADYDTYEAAKSLITNLPYANPTKKPATPEDAISAEDAKAKTAALYKSLRGYYESNAKAEGVSVATDLTDTKLVNPAAKEETGIEGWTDEGNAKIRLNGGESYTTAADETVAKYFDSDNWGANSFAGKFTQTVSLPNGKYLLSVRGRGYFSGTYQLIAGENNAVDIPNYGSTGGIFDKGWNMVFLEFDVNGESEETPVVLGINIDTNIAHSWISFNDFRLVQLSNVPTSIKSINAEEQSHALYNLQGQRVSQGQKGLYIRDGKKFIVR